MQLNTIELKETFIQYFGQGNNIRCFFSPGRVNLIGEHIDYNGGLVFPAALTLGITSLIRVNDSRIIRLRSMNQPSEIIINLDDPIYVNEDSWGNYPKGIFYYLLDEGFVLPGCDILYESDLPEGSGLSSSAALEVLTTYMMLTIIGKKDIDRIWIATFAQMVENKFIQVNCGIMDQFAVAMGKQDAAILLNCGTMDYEYIPLNLQEYSLVIMNTNKKRELTESKYNERRGECEDVLAILKKQYPVNNLCEISDERAVLNIQDEVLQKRARHVITENQRVIQSVESLKKNDLLAFASMLTASHYSLRYDYEVTGFELDTLVSEALKIKGCIGARMTGAGFGGCAIALVKTDVMTDFKRKVREAYHQLTRIEPSFYSSAIGTGVEEVLG